MPSELEAAESDNPTVRSDPLRAAFESRDLEQLLGVLDENVVWRGIQQPYSDTPLCGSRAEVREVFVNFLGRGGTGEPRIVAEVGDSVDVDPRPYPAPALSAALHQAFTFRGPRVVLMQDYPDRVSALESVGLS